MTTHRPVGAHWVRGAYREAADLGLTFCWMRANTLGNPAFDADWGDFEESALDCVLEIDVNEALVTDRGGCWRRDMENVYRELEQRGLIDRILAGQMADELHTRAANAGELLSAAAWPGLSRVPPQYRPGVLNAWLEPRVAELRAIWGNAWPSAGLGIAEAGGVADVAFEGLDWVGLNVYLGPGYYPDAASMARVYDQAAAGPYPLMPVLGIFDAAGHPLPSLFDLGRAYGPILEAHAARCWALGIFCLHHPSVYDGRHSAGRGLLQLDPLYREALRVFIHEWRQPIAA